MRFKRRLDSSPSVQSLGLRVWVPASLLLPSQEIYIESGGAVCCALGSLPASLVLRSMATALGVHLP